MTAEPLRYIVVYEQSPNNWGAYVPDLPGCVAVADIREEVRQLIKEAIEFHLEGMAEDNDAPPAPGYWAEEVEVRPPSPPVDEARPARSTG